MAERIFLHQSVLPSRMADVLAFHAAPEALKRLTMPPIIMQVRQDSRSSLTSGELAFTLWMGPLPVAWTARHEPGPIPTSFADVMVQGPLKSWRHEHIFEEIPGGVRLTDRITFEHKPGLAGLFSRLLFDGLPLRMLFLYRHWQTRRLTRRKKEV